MRRILVSLILLYTGTVQAANTAQDFTADFPDVNVPRVRTTSGAEVIDGWTGNALRLTQELTGQNQGVAFNQIFSGDYAALNVEFDMRFSASDGADGIGFALANVANFGADNQSDVPSFTENVNLAGTFGVGFDIYNNLGTEGENSVSLHWNNSTVTSLSIDDTALGLFETGNPLYTSINIVPVNNGSNVSVTVIDTVDGIEQPIFVDEFIDGFLPYDARPAFRARTGGQVSEQVIDNFAIHYTPVGAGNVVSFEEDFESFALGPITVIQEPVVVGGTPFVVKSPGTDPGPTIVNDGDGGGRQPGFMQLSSEATGQQNFVTFDKTSDEYENIHATFDFRILDQNGNFADGMAFVLAPTSLYGDSGELNPGETAAEWSPAEEPHLAGALGVGFDTFNNDFGLDFEGCPTEGDTDLACEEPGNSDRRANHISLHWDGSVNADHVAQTVIPLGDLDLANSAWNKADVQISTSEDGMLVSMTVTDGSDGSVHSIFDNFLIEGADFGGPVRASFGARTGGSSDFHSIDNVNIIFGEGIPYDFDGDGQLAVGDLELLRQAVMGETNPLEFDVTADGAVNSEDILSLVSDADKLNTYIGDSNLDGEFSSSDFVVVFGAGQYEDGVPNNSTWVTGDWNGDGEFDSGDFVFAFTAGGYELGPRGGVQSVPEPSTWILALWALLPFVQRFRRS